MEKEKMMDKTIEDKHIEMEIDFNEFKPGIQIGDYQIFDQIGGGSQAKIYSGKNKKTNFQLAVKVINKKIIEAEKNFKIRNKLRSLTEEESKNMMRIDSENVLKCYECYQSKDYKLMFIEYCNHGSLLDLLQEREAIPEYQSIGYLKQIINGIAACHEKLIIHRDIKLQNIFVHNGICKIADFGFSKFLEVQNQQQQALTKTILGNIDSMAPQVIFIQQYGLKADIWSIGVIFYQMLFGRLPFIYKGVNSNRVDITEYLNKRIKQISNSEIIQGIKPSVQVKKFFKDTFVIDPVMRIGWTGLIQHQIFKIQPKNLPNTFLRKSQFKSNSKILEENQKMQSFEKRQSKKSEIMDIKGKDLPSEQGKLPRFKSRIMAMEEIKQQKQKINREQDILYQWGQFIHVDCLRAQCIVQKIIKPIEEFQLLDMRSADTIKMMFLLSTRCLNYISPIHQEYNKKKGSKIITQLHEIVAKLYKEIREKWNFYSRKLGPFEQKNVKRKDWYENVINQYKASEQDIFFAGIQDMKEYIPNIWKQSRLFRKSRIEMRATQPQGLSNYTKIQQIDFTDKFIKDNINKLKQSKITNQVKNYLSGFSQICLLEQKELNTFKYLLGQLGEDNK